MNVDELNWRRFSNQRMFPWTLFYRSQHAYPSRNGTG